MLESTFGSKREDSDVQVSNKSAWEVVIEFAALTSGSEKALDQRVDDLKSYCAFYGYNVEDYKHFIELITIFLKEAAKVEKIIEGIEEDERKLRLAGKEKKFKEMQECYKDLSYNKLHPEPARKSHNILNRPVTLLLSADEKMVESYETMNPSQSLESQLDRLTITEFSFPDLEVKRRTSTSVYLKRSRPELTPAVQSANNFSESALKVIFSYLDYGSFKFTNPDFIVVGNFAILVIEVLSYSHL